MTMDIQDPQGETRDDVNKMISESIKWRGTVVDKCIFLERCIDNYLAYFFCLGNDEKGQQLIELILSTDRITFSGKQQVLKFVIDKYKMDFVAKYPNYNKDIVDLIQHRNIFAHYLLDTTNAGVIKFREDGTIGFLKFKNSMEVGEYSVANLEKIRNDLHKYMNAFRIEVTAGSPW